MTIVIPCRNEATHIGVCLASIVAGGYPLDRLEVLVVDGMSEDGSRAIVEGYARRHGIVQLLDNPARITPVAFNLGFKAARGEVITIMSAHAAYAPGYLERAVGYLASHGADAVGGIRRTAVREATVIGRAIARAISHPFTAGTARYRTGVTAPRWVDTAFGASYRREVFERVGLFNEALVKGQDREFNHRLRAGGGRILLIPEIQCTYFGRSGLGRYCRWMFEAGIWPFLGSRVAGGRMFGWRNFAPPALVAGVAGLAVGAWLTPVATLALGGVLGAYAVGLGACAVRITCEEGDARFLLAVPLVFAATHLAYGLGALYGIVQCLRSVRRRSSPRPASAASTAPKGARREAVIARRRRGR